MAEKCAECGHRHAGPQLGGICIGCPCPVVTQQPVEDPTGNRLQCMTCTSRIEPGEAKAKGWLVDEYPTPGGTPLKVVICFPCRQKTNTAEAAERKPCGGTCKGDYAHPDGWRAICTWLGHCEESWSCWDENCVREWAAEHDEPHDCETCHQPVDHDTRVKRISEWQQAKAGAR